VNASNSINSALHTIIGDKIELKVAPKLGGSSSATVSITPDTITLKASTKVWNDWNG